MSEPDQACVDCHFFVVEYRDRDSLSLSGWTLPSYSEKTGVRTNDFSWHKDSMALVCAYGVWDQGFRFDSCKKHELIVQTERKDRCFFLPWHPGMLIPAAKTLQERQAAYREANRDRRLTVWGLWIAAVALVVNAILVALDLALK